MTDYELISHLEMCVQMHVTSVDAESSQAWEKRRNKARAILPERIEQLEHDLARAIAAIAEAVPYSPDARAVLAASPLPERDRHD